MFNLAKHLKDQFKFSVEAFGPPNGSVGVIDHIEKELVEVKAKPQDLEEWIDLLILASDGAMREGHTVEDIIMMWEFKLAKNKKRKWPDWKTAEPGKAIEHIRKDELTGNGLHWHNPFTNKWEPMNDTD